MPYIKFYNGTDSNFLSWKSVNTVRSNVYLKIRRNARPLLPDTAYSVNKHFRWLKFDFFHRVRAHILLKELLE